MKPLEGRVALVAGATRGTGRGIAAMLGEAGATVYCTGRSTRANRGAQKVDRSSAFSLDLRPETIEETAELVTEKGGKGIAVQVDHTVAEQVQSLVERIRKEQRRLDILVNDIWGGDELMIWGKPFWEQDLWNGLTMIERGIFTHIITSRYAAPLLIETGNSLIVEITDGDGFFYRGSLFYDFVKTAAIRLAYEQSVDLRPHGVTALAVTPGFLRSEAMLDHFGVTENNWQEAAVDRPDFSESETPFFVGRVVAALAADPNVSARSGRVYGAWDLAPEYGIRDVDGRQPHFINWLEKNRPDLVWKKCDDTFYSYWTDCPYGLPE